MQRTEALIEKLKQQLHSGAPVPQLLVTLQMLHTEITGGAKETSVLGASGVSVVIPGASAVRYATQADLAGNNDAVYYQLPNTDASDEEIEELLMQQAEIEKLERQGNIQEPKPAAKKSKEPVVTILQPELEFGKNGIDFLAEVPTFTQYAKPVGANKAAEEQPATLQKTIRQEDRNVFVHELFRGDVNMYERSIKTIDNFHTYAEAEFWIRRELKIKVGWLPNNAAAAKFDQLVKKRFS